MPCRRQDGDIEHKIGEFLKSFCVSQLLLEDPDAFPRQMRTIIPTACSGSTPGLLPAGRALKTSEEGASRITCLCWLLLTPQSSVSTLSAGRVVSPCRRTE